MSDKFTIRDFLVYFLTGVFLLVSALYVFKNSLFDYFDIDISKAKDYSTLYIFLLLPGLYLIGHIVQGLDYILFQIGSWLYKKINNKLIRYVIVSPLLNQRIMKRLKELDIEEKVFWEACSYLIVKSCYSKADYWNIMHTLFEGLTLISVGWVCYFIISFSAVNLSISLLLTIIFWFRARQMAYNFIKTVKNNISCLGKIKG